MNTRPEAWLEILRDKGYRVTAARRAVVNAVFGSGRALTPSEVYKLARKTYRALGLVTVYRTLEALETHGLIQRVHQVSDCQAFISSPLGHRHLLLCQACGQTMPFEGDDLDSLMQTLSRKTGYQINEHWLQLFGLCPSCK